MDPPLPDKRWADYLSTVRTCCSVFLLLPKNLIFARFKGIPYPQKPLTHHTWLKLAWRPWSSSKRGDRQLQRPYLLAQPCRKERGLHGPCGGASGRAHSPTGTSHPLLTLAGLPLLQAPWPHRQRHGGSLLTPGQQKIIYPTGCSPSPLHCQKPFQECFFSIQSGDKSRQARREPGGYWGFIT